MAEGRDETLALKRCPILRLRRVAPVTARSSPTKCIPVNAAFEMKMKEMAMVNILRVEVTRTVVLLPAYWMHPVARKRQRTSR